MMAPSELVTPVTRNTASIFGNCNKSIWHLLTTTRVGSKAGSNTPVSGCLGPGEESSSVAGSEADITITPADIAANTNKLTV